MSSAEEFMKCQIDHSFDFRSIAVSRALWSDRGY
jgi:hypothetical protein